MTRRDVARVSALMLCAGCAALPSRSPSTAAPPVSERREAATAIDAGVVASADVTASAVDAPTRVSATPGARSTPPRGSVTSAALTRCLERLTQGLDLPRSTLGEAAAHSGDPIAICARAPAISERERQECFIAALAHGRARTEREARMLIIALGGRTLDASRQALRRECMELYLRQPHYPPEALPERAPTVASRES